MGPPFEQHGHRIDVGVDVAGVGQTRGLRPATDDDFDLRGGGAAGAEGALFDHAVTEAAVAGMVVLGAGDLANVRWARPENLVNGLRLGAPVEPQEARAAAAVEGERHEILRAARRGPGPDAIVVHPDLFDAIHGTMTDGEHEVAKILFAVAAAFLRAAGGSRADIEAVREPGDADTAVAGKVRDGSGLLVGGRVRAVCAEQFRVHLGETVCAATQETHCATFLSAGRPPRWASFGANGPPSSGFGATGTEPTVSQKPIDRPRRRSQYWQASHAPHQRK